MEASAARSIGDSIKELAGFENTFGVICTVKSVNETDRLCDCTPVDGGADILEVKLMANIDKGFYVIPKVDSFVIVSLTSPSAGYVTMFSQVDNVELNGKNFDGLVKISDQTTKLNLLVTQLQAELVKIATGLAGVGGVYTPGTITSFSKSDYENTTVKHGDGT